MGFDYYLSKSVRIVELNELIKYFFKDGDSIKKKERHEHTTINFPPISEESYNFKDK